MRFTLFTLSCIAAVNAVSLESLSQPDVYSFSQTSAVEGQFTQEQIDEAYERFGPIGSSSLAVSPAQRREEIAKRISIIEHDRARFTNEARGHPERETRA